jgi:hypothetical protein
MVVKKELTDAEQKLVSAFNAAQKRLSGSTGKAAGGIENEYGASYQALVKAGLAPQLRQKHRTAKHYR